MPHFLLLVISMAGLTAGAARLKVPRESAPLVGVSLAGSALYLFGLAGWLSAGVWFVFLAGLILFAACSWRARDDQTMRASLLCLPFVLFVTSIAVLWACGHGWQCSGWDEFSHWAFAAKELLRTHALMSPDNALIFKHYPPGVSVWQYFFNRLLGSSEAASYLATNTLLVAALIPVLPSGSWRAWKSSALIAVLLYLMLVTFGFGFHTLYVDQLLAAYFGGAVVTYFRGNRQGRGPLDLVPILFFLPLVKPSGTFLAYTVVMAISVDSIVRWRQRGGRISWQTAATALLLVAAPILAHKSWSFTLQSKGLSPSPITFPLATVFNAKEKDEKRDFVTKRFERAFFDEPLYRPGQWPWFKFGLSRLGMRPERVQSIPSPNLGSAFWLFVLGLLTLATVVWQPSSDDRRRTIARQAVLSLFFGIFMLGLLSLYRNYFSEREGRMLASYGRYVATFIFGWMLANTAAYFDALSHLRAKVWQRRLAAALPLFLFVFCVPAPAPTEALPPFRETASRVVRKIRPNSRVYLVAQNSNGFERYILNYQIAPAKVNEQCWSLGRPYSPSDVWTCRKSRDEWVQTLLGYDFVVVGNTDQNFWKEYGDVFPQQSAISRGFLYEVRRTEEKKIALIPR